MTRCILSLGSNRGNPLRNLAFALQALRRLPRTRVARVSSIFESSPVGAGKQRDYLNMCAEIKTDLSPTGLLIEFKRIEAALGRRPRPRWASRPIDIDLLFYGRMRLRTRHLTLPHPRLLKRKFVLVPLAEILPAARVWAKRLNAPSQNVKLFISAPPPNVKIMTNKPLSLRQ